MGLPLYLAMTAAELGICRTLPQRVAYMACHFSPYGTGLVNIPEALPPGSILMVNDRTPVMGHDPDLIAKQVQEATKHLQTQAVLLDFQRPNEALTGLIAEKICNTAACPVAVSECYAQVLDCCVFANAVPANSDIEKHLIPWQGRRIWLEAALDSVLASVTAQGCRFSPAPLPPEDGICHKEDRLFCHYQTAISNDRAAITLFRTREDLDGLLEKAEQLGVCAAVGLFQELGQKEKPLE